MSWEQRNEDFSKAQTDAQMAYIEAEREVRRLESENARLRQEIKVVGTVAYVHGVKQLQDENAKLRELVRTMFYTVHPLDREQFLANVTELGVEVSDA